MLGRTNSYQRAMPTSSLFLRSPHNTTGVWSYSLVTLRNLVPLIKTGENQADLADLVCTKSNSSFRLTPAEVVCFVFNILVRKVRVSGPQGKCTVGGSEGWGRPLGGRSRGNEKGRNGKKGAESAEMTKSGQTMQDRGSVWRRGRGVEESIEKRKINSSTPRKVGEKGWSPLLRPTQREVGGSAGKLRWPRWRSEELGGEEGDGGVS